jgi:hypothetical protein
MTQAASQAAAFFRDVARTRHLWTVTDAQGVPTSNDVMPFWSSQSRVTRIIARVPAYAGFEPCQLTLADFLEQWLPDLERDVIRVGANRSGTRAVGYDYLPHEVRQRLEWELQQLQGARI